MRRKVVVAALLVILLTAVAGVSSFGQSCCFEISPGSAMPADHNWQYNPANPNLPNLMMHAKLCLANCPTWADITGVRLQAGGTGNSTTDINWIRVTWDLNCDGVAQTSEPSQTVSGGFPTTGVLDICNPAAPITVSPGKCICVLIEYNLKSTAPCNSTYFFYLTNVLTGSNCQPAPVCNQTPLKSAVKTVICQECCLVVDRGVLSPADHVYSCSFGNNPPNYMSQIKICNPCPTEMAFDGLVLQAFGTGNDLTGIQTVGVFLDKDCDGKQDAGGLLFTGSYTADNGVLKLCDPTKQYILAPGQCICLVIYYKMNCSAPPGTYGFYVTGLLGGPNCLPICVNTHNAAGTLIPLASQPVQSAVKTIEQCCLQVSKGPHFPPDHVYVCDPTVPNTPNFMAEYKICNPCQTVQCFGGIQITAGGTGPLSAIQSVLVSLDYNCDGVPESVNVLTGNFASGSNILDLCKQGGAFCIEPNQCICVRVEYVMNCDAPPGTYFFNLTGILGTDCKPVCANPLPIQSAVKTVDKPCCIEASPGPAMPVDHTFTCPPVGTPVQPNRMAQVRICNPCDKPMPIGGVELHAYGSGNDLTGISSVFLALDKDCDGKDDQVFTVSGTYPADDGVLSLCTPGNGLFILQPGECVCLNIYYMMKCPDAVPGTYYFEVTNILGADCKPLCNLGNGLPFKSAIKTIEPEPCCLDVTYGPNNPPSHNWWPGMPTRNRMFQFRVCNPCTDPAKINCFRLQAMGSGNDQNDILQVMINVDLNCNGLVDPGEPLFGGGAYPADNGLLTVNGSYLLPPAGPNGPSCMCFLVTYIMKPWPVPTPPVGATYCMSLTQICAVNAITGADFCKKGLPLNSNCKKRCKKVWEVKHLPPGTVVCLLQKVVTGTFADRHYIQDKYADDATEDEYGSVPDRTAGVAVLGQINSPTTGGVVVDIEGIVDIVNCEVVVRPLSEVITEVGLPPIKPLGMNNKTSGGEKIGYQSGVIDSFFDVFFAKGLNNVGLFEAVWGTVTAMDGAGNFWINDGSDLKDGSIDPAGSKLLGIKVNASQAGVIPSLGAYVRVQGIMRAEDYFGRCIRVMYPRTRTDVNIVGP